MRVESREEQGGGKHGPAEKSRGRKGENKQAGLYLALPGEIQRAVLSAVCILALMAVLAILTGAVGQHDVVSNLRCLMLGNIQF
jgi:hypothetical protein